MKTRVVAVYDHKWGRDVFQVHAFRDYDMLGPKGEHWCHTMGGTRWRVVFTVLDRSEAMDLADNLSRAGVVIEDRVLIEFEDGRMVLTKAEQAVVTVSTSKKD